MRVIGFQRLSAQASDIEGLAWAEPGRPITSGENAKVVEIDLIYSDSNVPYRISRLFVFPEDRGGSGFLFSHHFYLISADSLQSVDSEGTQNV